MNELKKIKGFNKFFVELKNWEEYKVLNNFVDLATNKNGFTIGVNVGRTTKKEKEGFELCITFEEFCAEQCLRIELTRFNSNAHLVIQQRDDLIKELVQALQEVEYICERGIRSPTCPLCGNFTKEVDSKLGGHSKECLIGNALQKAKEYFK